MMFFTPYGATIFKHISSGFKETYLSLSSETDNVLDTLALWIDEEFWILETADLDSSSFVEGITETVFELDTCGVASNSSDSRELCLNKISLSSTATGTESFVFDSFSFNSLCETTAGAFDSDASCCQIKFSISSVRLLI